LFFSEFKNNEILSNSWHLSLNGKSNTLSEIVFFRNICTSLTVILTLIIFSSGWSKPDRIKQSDHFPREVKKCRPQSVNQVIESCASCHPQKLVAISLLISHIIFITFHIVLQTYRILLWSFTWLIESHTSLLEIDILSSRVTVLSSESST